MESGLSQTHIGVARAAAGEGESSFVVVHGGVDAGEKQADFRVLPTRAAVEFEGLTIRGRGAARREERPQVTQLSGEVVRAGGGYGICVAGLGVVPVAVGGFGNYLVPLQIGAGDMAFPKLNMASYWSYFCGGLLMLASFFAPGGAALLPQRLAGVRGAPGALRGRPGGQSQSPSPT